jgi:release factor glutamine methyltransferase
MEGIHALQEHEVPDPEYDAIVLLTDAAKLRLQDYILHANEEATEELALTYRQHIKSRGERVPLQHITGSQDFMGYEFYVNEDVLIPRQDTETLVIEAEKYLRDDISIVDVCTGSGCILLSLLKRNIDRFPHITAQAIDLSDRALTVAKKNGEALGLSDRVTFIQGDLLMGQDECYDVIVSNPPYIPSTVIPSLMPEVRDHDPLLALDGGQDGYDLYRRLIPQAYERLRENGMLLLEIGYDQSAGVSQLMTEAGFVDIETIKDLGGCDRVVVGRKRV